MLSIISLSEASLFDIAHKDIFCDLIIEAPGTISRRHYLLDKATANAAIVKLNAYPLCVISWNLFFKFHIILPVTHSIQFSSFCCVTD